MWSEYYLSSNMNFYPKEWIAPQLEPTETPFLCDQSYLNKKNAFSEILQNKAIEH